MSVWLEGAILAAGRGERLRADGPDIPKPLVTLQGRPLLARQAEVLSAAGAERVVAVINSETASLLERKALPAGLRITIKDTANSMETLFELGQHLSADWFVGATVDAVVPQAEMNRFVNHSRALIGDPALAIDGTLAVVRWRGDKHPLFVQLAENGIEDGIEEGIIRRVGGDGGALVTAGVYFLPRKVFDFESRARQAGLSALRQFLGGLVDWGMRLYAVPLQGVIDVDVREDLEAARQAVGSGLEGDTSTRRPR